MSNPTISRDLLGKIVDEVFDGAIEDASVIEEIYAAITRHESLSPLPQVVGHETCDRCQGNGEIVTDWERYKHPHEGDKGDEAVAECPDCGGEGIIDHPAAQPAPSDQTVGDNQPRYTTKRLHDEIAKARAYGMETAAAMCVARAAEYDASFDDSHYKSETLAGSAALNAIALKIREQISSPAPVEHVVGTWRPIAEADRTITEVEEFPEADLTLRMSDRYWVRDDDGRIYEAAWSEGNNGGRDFWWDFEGESPVDPVEFMPHPLDQRFATATEGSGE